MLTSCIASSLGYELSLKVNASWTVDLSTELRYSLKDCTIICKSVGKAIQTGINPQERYPCDKTFPSCGSEAESTWTRVSTVMHHQMPPYKAYSQKHEKNSLPTPSSIHCLFTPERHFEWKLMHEVGNVRIYRNYSNSM